MCHFFPIRREKEKGGVGGGGGGRSSLLLTFLLPHVEKKTKCDERGKGRGGKGGRDPCRAVDDPPTCEWPVPAHGRKKKEREKRRAGGEGGGGDTNCFELFNLLSIWSRKEEGKENPRELTSILR